MTDPSLMVFGEALGRAAIIPRMTQAITAITPDFPHRSDELGRGGELKTFPANLYPPLNSLREAFRNMLLTWFAEPAFKAGFQRWGVKEVRLSAAEAMFLKWLFPRATFLVLTRHPIDVFVSSRDWSLWYSWPERPVDGGIGVVRHWNRLAVSWKSVPADWGHRIVRYEDMVAECDWGGLERACGLALDPERVLEKRTGGTKRKRAATKEETTTVLRITRDGRAAMGYDR
jgi:hypothetical protein